MTIHHAVETPAWGTWQSNVRRTLPAPALSFALAVKRQLHRGSNTLSLLRESIYDFIMYHRWYHDGRQDQFLLQQESALLKQFHGIEKGLSLMSPRPGFGELRVKAIADRIDSSSRLGETSSIRRAAEDALAAYFIFNKARGCEILWLKNWLLERGLLNDSDQSSGGTQAVQKVAILRSVQNVGPDFFMSRHSVRQFSDEPVPIEGIGRAVDMARKTPSVCNRQGARVHCFKNPGEALKWQPGNSGFGHLASRALVVTCDLQAFSSPGERHQAYVDGGLFAMSLVYALHSLGYGTCMLAWSQEHRTSAKAKEALGIPASETIIMMIAVGCLPEVLEVARSYRRSASEIMRVH